MLCLRSILDSDTNNLSLIDLFEEVTLGMLAKTDVEKALAEDKPILVPLPSEIVTLWIRGTEDQPERARARILLEPPSGKTIASVEYDVDLSKFNRLRSRSKSPGLPFVGAGKYIFHVQFRSETDENWKDVARLPLVVKVDFNQLGGELPAQGTT